MRRLSWILFGTPLLFLAYFFFYPLWRILQQSLRPAGVWEFGGIAQTVYSPFFGRLLWFTSWQALVSTALTLLLGLPLAFLFARYRFPGKRLLQALTTVPFVMPTVVVATAFTTLFGSRGVINGLLMHLFALDAPPVRLLQTVWIILLAHAFYNVAVVVRSVGGFWANLSPKPGEAAAVLGAAPGRVWREVTLPLLVPSIIAAGLLVFLFCFTSFGVVIILGGLRFATIEVEIYRQAVSLFIYRLPPF